MLVVEAKGAGGGLGTKTVNGRNREQGTTAYMREIARLMENKTTDPDLLAALQAIRDAGSSSGPKVQYILIRAPVNSNGEPRNGVIKEFEI